jgi:DNA polymerase-3 subunit gamma/tau
LRDALSLLDQAIVYGSGAVNLQDVNTMLGTVAQQPVDDLMMALAEHNAKKCLDIVAQTAELSPDFADLLQQLLRVLHRVAITQKITGVDDQEFDKTFIDQLANNLSAEDVQLFYQIGLIGQRDLALAPDPRSGFEMVLLRMLTFRPLTGSSVASPISTVATQISTQEPKPSATVARTPSPSTSKLAETPSAKPVTETNTPTAEQWPQIITALKIGGRTRELANNCILESIDDHVCKLLIDPAFQRVGSIAEEKLRDALQKYFGRALKLQITSQTLQQMTPALEIQKAREDRQQAAVDAIQDDPQIQALQATFDARLVSDSVEPLN